jgi:hypothetical protein
MLVAPDFDAIQRSLKWSCPTPDTIIEIRTLTAYRGFASVGYFNDPVLAANIIVNSDNEGIAGAYATLNPVTPEAFARCSNRMVSGKAAVFTHDKEILERRELLLDFDPVRLSGISSTEAEHQAALDFMVKVTDALTFLYGWPAPCLIDSGNGGHARYRLERLANTLEITELVKNVLRVLDHKYSNERVTIDKSNFNASRICRIPGTVARKGEHTAERPHRVSRILRPHDPFAILRRDVLDRLIVSHGGPPPKAAGKALRAAQEYPADEAMYRQLNTTSRDRFNDWVPHLLGDLARPSGEGYRISSRDLGRDLEEDIYIGPTGIKDFGVADMGDATEGRRTALTLLAELFGKTKREAAAQLSMTLNTPMNEFEGKALQDPAPEPLPDTPVNMPPGLMGSPAEYRGLVSIKDIDPFSLNRMTWKIEDFVLNKHFTMITAPPKIGKSTISRMMVASLTTGLPFLGRMVHGGPVGVLYVAYEDLMGDMVPETKRCMRMLIEENGMSPYTGPGALMYAKAQELFKVIAEQEGDIGFFEKAPRGKPGLDFLRGELQKHPEIKVMFVDPLRFLRDETQRSRNIVDQEYVEGMDFKAFAQETGVSIVGLHHSNKESGKKSSEGNDPLLSAGGTAAVTGAPGNTIIFMGDRVPEGIEGHIGLYRAGRIGSPKMIMVMLRDGRFYLSPPDSEIFYLRKLSPGGMGGRGQGPGRPTDGPSGKEVDGLIEKYLAEKKVGTVQLLSTTLNIREYTVSNRLKVLMDTGVVERFDDEIGLFKTPGPGGKPILYRLKDRVRLPD